MHKIYDENKNYSSIKEAIDNATSVPQSTQIDKTIKRYIDTITYLNAKYDFLYNVVTGDLEFKEKSEKEYRIIQDRDIRTIRVELAIAGFRMSVDDFRDVIYSEYVSIKYHPFRSYFDKLQLYEGKCEYKNGKFISTTGRDYIKEFTNQIKLKNEALRNYLIEGFRKWFVGLVVSIYDDEISMYKINQICLILVGGQAKYKTTFFEKIVPKQLRDEYFYSGSFNFADKDNERRMATKMIMSMEEMASYSKTDIEIVKAKITQSRVVVRPAFYRTDLRLKRRVSFCGTQNNREFLKDETGSRRFLVYEIENIVIDENFPIDKMFAQGLQHYRDGFQYWLDSSEIEDIEKMNEIFQLRTMEYEFIFTNYENPNDEDIDSGIKYLTASDIAVELCKEKNINVNNTVVKNIGYALSSLGFKKVAKKINNSTKYFWKVKSRAKNSADEESVI